MNVTIYTLNGYYNYGNRLQLFALSKILKSMHIDNNSYWPRNKKENAKLFLKHATPLALRYKKDRRLRTFTKEYITKQVKAPTGKTIIVGSDQVWNPNYLKKYPHLLNTNQAKNISYAASIGASSLTNEQKEMFKSSLKKYSAISVREQSAKVLLQPLTNKKIEVVVDPTLLLDKAEYEALERRPKKLAKNEKYILCYILGNRDYESIIEKYAKANSYRTIYFSDKPDSNYGVEEFLYLIHHAEIICTDSFHACVFSFIFERPFIAFRRTGESDYMYTRLQNLIDTFKLKNREFNGKEITKENLEVDYTEAKEILKREQKKSLDFLKKALDAKK